MTCACAATPDGCYGCCCCEDASDADVGAGASTPPSALFLAGCAGWVGPISCQFLVETNRHASTRLAPVGYLQRRHRMVLVCSGPRQVWNDFISRPR